LLKALTEAEGILLREKIYHRGVRRAIECIGKGVALDMVQVYRIHENPEGGEAIECTHEWMHENPYMYGSLNVTAETLERVSPLWRETVERGEAWNMHFSEVDEGTRSFLSLLGMRSIILIGINPAGGDSGFILFGSSTERSGEDRHASSVLVSITESLRAYTETQLNQDELNRAKETAIAADHAKSEFLAIMSHEIRTPMNAIIGFSDLLQQTEMSEQQKDYVDIILRSGNDLLDLINNILDFSKLESNSIDLERTRFNMETAIMEALEMVLFKAKEKGIEVHYKPTEDIKSFYWGDPLRIRQILLNLLTNAVKFTHEGSVSLKVVTLEDDDPWYTLEFMVVDTGIGIPEENRGELFKAFRQSDTSTTREYGGSGLGLSIVQRLVDKMGGRVSMESTVGKGSSFCFVIRLERDRTDDTKEHSPGRKEFLDTSFAEQNPLSILVVEDDLVNTRLMCEVLGRLGYEVEAVSDGYKALAVLAENRHNVVLMDMQMARLDGLETTVRIRAGECGDSMQGINIIALTALALPEEKERILESGVDYYLSKPIGLQALKDVLGKVAKKVSV
jgi:signal transduction histidine kinase/CheY-like chemotaxis protein